MSYNNNEIVFFVPGERGMLLMQNIQRRQSSWEMYEKMMKHQILLRYPLGNPRRVWRQDNFILSTFSAHTSNMRDSLENCTEAGYTLLEMGWASHERAEAALRLCEELKIDLLLQDFSVFGGMQTSLGSLDNKNWNAVREVVNHVRPYRYCYGYYLWDQPFWDEELEEARRIIDLFQREDPQRLPFSVAVPSYNEYATWENGEFPAYLEKYTKVIDPPILSLDYYPIGLISYHRYTDHKQLDDSLLWCDLGLLRLLGRKYHIPLWFYYQGMNLHEYDHFEFPMVRAQMYAAALYGCKALQQFTAVGSVIDEKGDKGVFFEEQKQIHTEFRKLGNTLMALENRYVFHSSDVLPGVPFFEGLSDSLKDSNLLCGTLPKRVSVGELSDAYGNEYLMVLNRDFTAKKTVNLSLKKTFRLYEVSRQSGKQVMVNDGTRTLSVSLDKGDAVLYRLQDASEEAFTVEYRLEK